MRDGVDDIDNICSVFVEVNIHICIFLYLFPSTLFVLTFICLVENNHPTVFYSNALEDNYTTDGARGGINTSAISNRAKSLADLQRYVHNDDDVDFSLHL